MKTWSDTDSLYGTRHLAEKWEKDGTLKKIKALMVMDMIGDADLDINRTTNGTAWLLDSSTPPRSVEATSPTSTPPRAPLKTIIFLS